MLLVKKFEIYYLFSLLILTAILSNNYHGKEDWPFIQTQPSQMDPPIPQHNICCAATICVRTAKLYH